MGKLTLSMPIFNSKLLNYQIIAIENWTMTMFNGKSPLPEGNSCEATRLQHRSSPETTNVEDYVEDHDPNSTTNKNQFYGGWMVFYGGLIGSNGNFNDIWLVVYLPLWKMMEFVSWDDDIPNMMGKIEAMFQTTNQMKFIQPLNLSKLAKSSRVTPPHKRPLAFLTWQWGVRYCHRPIISHILSSEI